jgi:hypothetical protein
MTAPAKPAQQQRNRKAFIKRIFFSIFVAPQGRIGYLDRQLRDPKGRLAIKSPTATWDRPDVAKPAVEK